MPQWWQRAAYAAEGTLNGSSICTDGAGVLAGSVLDHARAALAVFEPLIIPFLPRSGDEWALSGIAALVDGANGVRDGV